MGKRCKYGRSPVRVTFGRDMPRGPDIWTLSISWAPIAHVPLGSRASAHGIDISWRNPIIWFKY